MNGRFIGPYLLHIYSPGKVLASAAAVAILLLAIAGADTGAFSGWRCLRSVSPTRSRFRFSHSPPEAQGAAHTRARVSFASRLSGRHRIYGSMACAAG
jgi:hypothetical protein